MEIVKGDAAGVDEGHAPTLRQKLAALWERLSTWSVEPVDVLPLAWFRIVYGATLCYWAVKALTVDSLNWMYVLPRYHFPYYGFDWVQVLSAEGMHNLYLAIAILGVAVVFGAFYRVTSLLLGLCFCYVFLIDKAYYQNHYYLLSLGGLVLPFLPCHRALSIDAALFRNVSSPWVPNWSLFAARFLVGIPYFYGGIAKINSDWLAGQPMRMVLASSDWHPVLGPWVTEEWFVQGFVWSGLLFDLLVVPALLWKRTRVLALILALVFHLTNATLFIIGVFPWFMIGATLIFLPASSFRTFFRLPMEPPEVYRRPSQIRQRVTFPVLVLFVSVQLAWPLRHHLLDGRVDWTEHGHYFSWRMKLRGKRTMVRFEAFDPRSKARESVDPQRWLSVFQLSRMARDPKMVHEFARFLKQQYADQGYPEVQVRAVVLCSLNGRKPQLLIDPLVDLGGLPRQWGAPTYVLPLTKPLLFEAWDVPRSEWVNYLPAALQRQPADLAGAAESVDQSAQTDLASVP